MSPDAILRAADIGRILGRHPRTIRKWWDRGWLPVTGRLPSRRGDRYVTAQELKEWVEICEAAA